MLESDKLDAELRDQIFLILRPSDNNTLSSPLATYTNAKGSPLHWYEVQKHVN